MKALIINIETWSDNTNANLRYLKRDVGQLINNSTGYEKTMWERIKMELEQINVENLGFDHPICSGVLDIKLKPFIEMPESLCNIFKESFEKYKLDHNDIIMDTCKEIIYNEESKINLDEDLHNIEFGKWLNSFEKLQKMIRQILEFL